jgi:hypothetical protein
MSTYSFQDVAANLDGPTGTADLGYGAAIAKEGITINSTQDKNTMTIGADGEGTHNLHADKSGNVIVRVLKTSPLNAVLHAHYDAQQLSASLWGQNIIVVRQTQSGDITTCKKCAFAKKPDLTYADESGLVEWHFHSIKIDTILGVYLP